MKVKITCNYPKSEVLALVKFASEGTGNSGVRLWIKNNQRGSFAGRAYYGGKISARIGKPSHFPTTYRYPRLKTAPEYTLNDWKEALVTLVAHELRHQQQYRLNRPASEINAERWAVRKLEEYRRTRIG